MTVAEAVVDQLQRFKLRDSYGKEEPDYPDHIVTEPLSAAHTLSVALRTRDSLASRPNRRSLVEDLLFA